LDAAPLPRLARSLVSGLDNGGIVVRFAAGTRDGYYLQIVVNDPGAHAAS
jgi:hypothetical protein